MSFVFFDGSNTQTTSPRISIRRGGLLVLNGAAARMLGENVTHVQLGYDAEKNAVAIREAPADALGRYKLRTAPKGSSRMINGKRLFEHHGLDAEKARRFNVEDFGDGLIGLYLNGKADEAPKADTKAKPRPKKKAA